LIFFFVFDSPQINEDLILPILEDREKYVRVMGDAVIQHGRFHPNGRIVLNWHGMRSLENGISPRPCAACFFQRKIHIITLRVHVFFLKIENADWKEKNIIVVIITDF
jgi:hypothetical protein